MAKSPDAFRTISEVSEWLDTPAHVLRFWESKFPQIKPVQREGGRRYYRPEDVQLLAGIKFLLHEKGMTIKGVQKMLREEGAPAVAALVGPIENAAEPKVRRKPVARIVQLRPHSAGSEAQSPPKAVPAPPPEPEARPAAPTPPVAKAPAPQPPATERPPAPSPAPDETNDMQFSLFQDDPIIPDDPEDTDNFAPPRALGPLLRADPKKLGRKRAKLAALSARLAEIHPQN